MNRSHNHQVAINTARLLNVPVFPVREKDFSYTIEKSGKKRVLKAKSPYTKNGFKAASKDEKEIDKLWLKYPNAAVGVPTGLESGLLVMILMMGMENEAVWPFQLELHPLSKHARRLVVGI